MAKVSATVSYVDLDGYDGVVEGVELTCERCGHSEESYGAGETSVNHCAVLLRENCPRKENNYYETSW